MADPTDPTDWEKAYRGKAQDAYTRAGQAAEPLEGKTREPPPEKTAVQSHGMRQTMEPAAMRKLEAEKPISAGTRPMPAASVLIPFEAG